MKTFILILAGLLAILGSYLISYHLIPESFLNKLSNSFKVISKFFKIESEKYRKLLPYPNFYKYINSFAWGVILTPIVIITMVIFQFPFPITFDNISFYSPLGLVIILSFISFIITCITIYWIEKTHYQYHVNKLLLPFLWLTSVEVLTIPIIIAYIMHGFFLLKSDLPVRILYYVSKNSYIFSKWSSKKVNVLLGYIGLFLLVLSAILGIYVSLSY